MQVTQTQRSSLTVNTDGERSETIIPSNYFYTFMLLVRLPSILSMKEVINTMEEFNKIKEVLDSLFKTMMEYTVILINLIKAVLELTNYMK